MTLEEQLGMIKEELLATPLPHDQQHVQDTLIDMLWVLEELARRVEHA